jgi:hypothetical protein
MNLYEGIKRVILVLSILVGAMVIFVAIEKEFTFGTVIWALIPSLLVLGAIWGVYQVVCWVVKGFVDKARK